MPLQATSGAASYDAFGGGVPVVPNYIEEVFSTYLYTGNGSTQTITNGIDLSTFGGLVWTKGRGNYYTNTNHGWFDTARGVNKFIWSNTTDAQGTESTLTNFRTTGFSLGADVNYAMCNGNTENYASWTFRKQPKFFDVVTFTTASDGSATVSHALGSTPGFVIVKRTDSTGLWFCWHTSLTSTNYYLFLNLTNAQTNSGGTWLTPSSTQVSFPSNTSTGALDSSANYVMYVFAHNAGGFGLTGTDNVISCGTFTPSSGEATVNLGYEPQWILWKSTTSSASWQMYDNMRGLPTGGDGDARLFANTSGAETVSTFGNLCDVTPTGFNVFQQSSTVPYIYIAIRRGPMKVPTSGTSVFSPNAQNTGTTPLVTTNFPVDLSIGAARDGSGKYAVDRLRGTNASASQYLVTSGTQAETASSGGLNYANNTGFTDGFLGYAQTIYWNWRRAPSFFDEVCYTGTGTYGASNHNLGVTPELVIYKSRSNAVNWGVIKPVSSIAYYDGLLNSNSAFTYYSNDPSVAGLYTSTQFAKYQDTSSYTYVAYLFATCAGVSKVGSYTGNGSTQTIDCGFTGGARFVLIKRTDSTGGWYVYDTARGMTVLTDPYLFLNDGSAETATLGSVTTVSTGFALDATILAAINTNAASYIFLAIA
jgi:hypothetical protein